MTVGGYLCGPIQDNMAENTIPMEETEPDFATENEMVMDETQCWWAWWEHIPADVRLEIPM